DGLTASVHCSVCNTTLIAQEPVPAGHTFTDWKTVTEPDCFFPGEETRICKVCDLVENRDVEPIAHSFVQDEETKFFSCELCDAVIYAGHLYATFDIPTHWFEAYEICDSLGGYLATITSSREQELIESMVSKGVDETGKREWINTEGYWLGAIKNTSGWEWVTGEDFDYSNWDQQEPTNDSISWFLGINGYAEWHDCVYTHIGETGLKFICEWELDIVESEHYFTEWEVTTETTCFGDGEQYRICTHCGLEEIEVLPQLEHNFVFNEATGVTSCEHCGAAMYDGRIYKIFNVQLSWFDAYSYCESLGGHLVTITSEEEQTFINTYMKSQSFSSRVWIGLYNDGESFNWITGEKFDYTNWNGDDPNCTGGTQYFGGINYGNLGKWTDDAPFSSVHSIICEWEAE
ncbi:MAG: C-type lectin domain-containing protein, partial [Clostridia bacterium]|nr:C-type lectin domain-containing protein [Clostridia bacterium]